jgi:hypothetical protein
MMNIRMKPQTFIEDWAKKGFVKYCWRLLGTTPDHIKAIAHKVKIYTAKKIAVLKLLMLNN